MKRTYVLRTVGVRKGCLELDDRNVLMLVLCHANNSKQILTLAELNSLTSDNALGQIERRGGHRRVSASGGSSSSYHFGDRNSSITHLQGLTGVVKCEAASLRLR